MTKAETNPPDVVAIQGIAAGGGPVAECRANLSAFWDFTAGFLPLATTIRGTRGGRAR